MRCIRRRIIACGDCKTMDGDTKARQHSWREQTYDGGGGVRKRLITYRCRYYYYYARHTALERGLIINNNTTRYNNI